MKTKMNANKRNLLFGFLAGICVVLSCAQSTDLVIYAKQVLFDDNAAKLGAANVQEAVEKVAAKAESIEWSKVTNRPDGLDDGDDVGNFTAGTGLKIDGTTISADIGTSASQLAGGDHTHPYAPVDHTHPYADVVHTHQSADVTDLDTSVAAAVTASAEVQTLQTKIAALEAQLSGDCPAGYAKDTTVTAYTLCKNGNDEMVKVGDFWVDRYEIRAVDATTYNGGTCDGNGTGYDALGATVSTFPLSGNWTAPLYACSISGVMPTGYATWFQANQLCVLAGKHLCTNTEWQAAAAGSPDAAGTCNIAATPGKLATGNNPACQSAWGAVDIVGNLSEWVAWWGPAGVASQTTDVQAAYPWPDYGDGMDAVTNLNGTPKSAVGAYVSGMPAAARRGGGVGFNTGAGVFAMQVDYAPDYIFQYQGARCCRR
jgi:formylglycine-generating enzyme required for sulfatase activity